MIGPRETLENIFQYMSAEPLKWSLLVVLSAVTWAAFLH